MKLAYVALFILMFLLCRGLLGLGKLIKQGLHIRQTYFPFLITGFEYGMLGVSLFGGAYGLERIGYIAIVDLGHELFIWFVFLALLLMQRDGLQDPNQLAQAFLKSPVIIAILLGLLLNVVVHPANLQDRDGAGLVLDRRTRRLFPFIERIFADAGYQGPRVAQAAASTGRWMVEIVKRNELHKFVVLPKRWIVERTLAWISRNRRLARDFERYARTVAAFVRLAMIRLMLRRLTRPTHST